MFGYLLSFHYYRDTDLDALAEAAGAPELTFFADSGAFSAEHAGAHITTHDYAAWLKRWHHRIHVYANLDVLHDPETSARNLEQLRELELEPLPVWHIGSPRAELERILAGDDPYIAIGGMVKASLTMRDPKLWRYLDLVHELAGAAGVALHGFGLGAWRVIERYPWYSADSSLASMGFRYGRVSAYDPYGNAWRSWHLRDRRGWGRYGWLVREYEMTPELFAGSNVEARAALITLAARSWSLAAKRLASRVYVAADTKQGREQRFLADWQQGNEWKPPRLYTTPHLSVSTIRGEGGTDTARGIMRAYEDGNRHVATQLYMSDPHPSANKNVERIGPWADGHRWTPAAPAAGASSGELEDAGAELALARADGGNQRNGR